MEKEKKQKLHAIAAFSIKVNGEDKKFVAGQVFPYGDEISPKLLEGLVASRKLKYSDFNTLAEESQAGTSIFFFGKALNGLVGLREEELEVLKKEFLPKIKQIFGIKEEGTSDQSIIITKLKDDLEIAVSKISKLESEKKELQENLNKQNSQIENLKDSKNVAQKELETIKKRS